MATPLNVPAPIRTDASNPFAHHTMEVRVPAMIDDVLQRNPDYTTGIVNSLSQLRQSVIDDSPLPLLNPFAPDYVTWQPILNERAGETWLNTVWFFAEIYLYRQIVECVRWWETGRDPFAPNKQEEYASDTLWKLLEAALGADGSPEERLLQAIHCALWSNRIDLSFAASRVHGTTVNDDDLVADHSSSGVERILRGKGDVHIIADNAGTELAMDLVLIDTILTLVDAPVVMHVKLHPMFVSDTIPADVWTFLSALEQNGGHYAALAARLRKAFDMGKLRVLPNGFWNTSRFTWELPQYMMSQFGAARLVISKGDANYRRLIGDAIWPADTPFHEATAYFPGPLLAMRTLKSDPIVGLASGMAETLEQIDPQWRVNGRRGVIQYRG